MDENEVLERLEKIGQSDANDLNDGDGPDYEGFTIRDIGNGPILHYGAMLEDGREVNATFYLELSEISIVGGGK